MYQVPLDRQTHTERFLVTDKWGNLRGQFHWGKPEQMTDMKALLDKLLAENTPPPAEPNAKTDVKRSDDDSEGEN